MASARFRYNREGQGRGAEEEEEKSRGQQEQVDEEVPCFLDMYVHDARNIHNICIYANQDVYAKFALTSAPDDELSTRVAAGGGASPSFDERLPPLRVQRGRLAVDVLKCEVWMRSCARTLLEDQLLGFALVPLAAIAEADGANLIAREFELSSTDLFHSPAGTIRLSLALHSGLPLGVSVAPPLLPERTSIASEVVILESAKPPSVDHYSRIEFPDLNAVKENHDMAVQYLPFLHLGKPPESDAMEMSTSQSGTNEAEKTASSSDDGSKNASTTTTADDDRVMCSTSSASNGAIKTPPLPDDVLESTTAPMSCHSPETPTSSNGKDGKEMGDVFTSPLGGIDIDMDAEQSEMQRQIMEMYLRSMQQFSESIAKMKMPIELNGGEDGVVVQKENKPDKKVKSDGARVFYGSRAFF